MGNYRFEIELRLLIEYVKDWLDSYDPNQPMILFNCYIFEYTYTLLTQRSTVCLCVLLLHAFAIGFVLFFIIFSTSFLNGTPGRHETTINVSPQNPPNQKRLSQTFRLVGLYFYRKTRKSSEAKYFRKCRIKQRHNFFHVYENFKKNLGIDKTDLD